MKGRFCSSLARSGLDAKFLAWALDNNPVMRYTDFVGGDAFGVIAQRVSRRNGSPNGRHGKRPLHTNLIPQT